MGLPLRAKVKKAVYSVEIHWLSDKEKLFWVQQSVKKVMLTVFCDKKGSIPIDILEKGAIVNYGSCCQFLRQSSPYLLKNLCICLLEFSWMQY